MDYLILVGLFAISFGCILLAKCLKEFSKFKLGGYIEDLKKENRESGRNLDARKERVLKLFEGGGEVHLPFLLAAYVLEAAFLLMLFWHNRTPLSAGGMRVWAVGLVIFAIYTVTIFLFNRLFATALAEERAEPIVVRNFLLIRGLYLLLLPLGIIAQPLGILVGKIVRFGKDVEDLEEDVEEDIKESITEGVEDGVLEETEKRMIESVLKFDDSDVKEIMTPRTDIVAVKASADLDTVLKLVLESGYSRIPAIGEDIDDITGVLYVKDLLQYGGRSPDEGFKIADIVREAYFIPESKMVSELFQEIREMKNHFAVVLDEYGGTAGIVTAEDIIEEIVGEIEDEYDTDRTELFAWRSEQVAEAHARIDIGELNERMEILLPDDGDYESLGGFLSHNMGKIPQINETFRFDNIRFKVLRATKRKILSVEVTKEGGTAVSETDE